MCSSTSTSETSVKLKTSPAFRKMNSTTDIYSEFSKIFRTTISRGRFCLNTSQEITIYWCDWFYFPVRPIWHSKERFSAKFLVKGGTRTPCTACLKKRCYSIVRIASVRYIQVKIETDVYMKLWVPNNLVLFLCHSGINCSVACG